MIIPLPFTSDIVTLNIGEIATSLIISTIVISIREVTTYTSHRVIKIARRERNKIVKQHARKHRDALYVCSAEDCVLLNQVVER